MFEKKKTKEEIEKEKARSKMKKKAEKYKKEQDLIKKRAERILDKDFVEKRLDFERKKDERKITIRDTRIAKMEDEILADEKETFACKICETEIGLGNITCPKCGQLYCQYCGQFLEMGDKFTGKCPKCGGFQNFTPAKLVQTRIEDIPEEERFWEALSECPKCGAAIQEEWDSCVICGAKLQAKKKGPEPDKEEKTIASIKAQRKAEIAKRRRQQKEGPKRGI